MNSPVAGSRRTEVLRAGATELCSNLNGLAAAFVDWKSYGLGFGQLREAGQGAAKEAGAGGVVSSQSTRGGPQRGCQIGHTYNRTAVRLTMPPFGAIARGTSSTRGIGGAGGLMPRAFAQHPAMAARVAVRHGGRTVAWQAGTSTWTSRKLQRHPSASWQVVLNRQSRVRPWIRQSR
jgi:hypothetical protein